MSLTRNIHRLFTLILMCLLTFSCQDSEPETLELQEEDRLELNSDLASLIQKISLNDGSRDNIIDGANCISIVLPVTVTANDTVLTIENEDDFQLVENIFEASNSDSDLLNIQFPISVIQENYEQSVVNSQEELESLINQCAGENEPDDDIECLDFKYPLTFKITFIGGSIPSTTTINNDKELYDFLNEVEEDFIVNISFPILLTDSKDEEIEVDNLEDLEDLIDESKDDCDEDDDFDYDDDDDAVIADFITRGNWIIDEFEMMDEEFTEEYEDYKFKFNKNGSVTAKNNQESVDGNWSVEVINSTTTRFLLNFESVPAFEALNQNWTVREIEKDELELVTGSEATGDLRILVFEKKS